MRGSRRAGGGGGWRGAGYGAGARPVPAGAAWEAPAEALGRPRVGPQEPDEDLDRRRLPRPVGPDEADDLARGCDEGQVPQGRRVAVGLPEVLDRGGGVRRGRAAVPNARGGLKGRLR